MAKRYGRNQRRRYREQIDALEADIRDWKERYGYAADKRLQACKELGDLRNSLDIWNADIRALLGRYSAFLFETGRIRSNDPICRIPLDNPLPAGSPTDWRSPSAVREVMPTITVLKHIVCLDEHHDRLRQLVRLIQEDAHGKEHLHLAYQVEGMTLMRMGERDKAHLAGDIAQLFQEKANGV